MLIRLVKLQLQTEKVSEFLRLFDGKKELIRRSNGCTHLELWRDPANPNVFYTYSIWQSEAQLKAYRHSELFRKTWKFAKTLFNEAPEAVSLESVCCV